MNTLSLSHLPKDPSGFYLISPREAHRLRKELFFVDVREESEFASLPKISYAVHIPLGSLEKRFSEIPIDRPVVFVCRSGGRSGRACEFALAQGRKNMLNMEGGMIHWQESMESRVFINRTLNLRKIKYIGLDMDHTLVRYNSEAFERLAHEIVRERLVSEKGYPEEILSFVFDYHFAVRGLVIDRKKGNLLKVSRHGAIRTSFHGLTPIDFNAQKEIYKSTYIDLSDDRNYFAIDTTFFIAIAVLYAQLVDFKDKHVAGKALPAYDEILGDLVYLLDQAHRGDSLLKQHVANHLDQFILRDEELVNNLEKYLLHGKKIFIITNSDYNYTKILLDYAVNPFLKQHKTWLDLFEIVITAAQKPRFFYDKLRFLKVNPLDGSMTNFEGKLEPGVYQGGCASQFTEDFQMKGDDILYIGDHIYGDILRLKKACNWRTALVIEELEGEIEGYRKVQPEFLKIHELMSKKEPIERRVVDLISDEIETGKKIDEALVVDLQRQITLLDEKISELIRKQQTAFNPYWGELMRAGNEESFLAHQVDRFACIYMATLSDLLRESPRSYFRAPRRPLAHEIAIGAIA